MANTKSYWFKAITGTARNPGRGWNHYRRISSHTVFTELTEVLYVQLAPICRAIVGAYITKVLPWQCVLDLQMA
jgi:hypothetical protein